MISHRIALAALIAVIPSALCFSLTAAQAADEAAKKGTLEESVSYLKSALPGAGTAADRRAIYSFLGAVQEQMGSYKDALDSYTKAAAIGAADAAGMPKKSSEQLVIDAVRCALSYGDWQTAQSFLNSAVRGTADTTIAAYIKLYEQWSILCKADNLEATKEAVAMLSAYSALESMKAVRPQILFTLWHITGEPSYSDELKKSFPKSPETAIVKGEIQTMPAPFWFFVPRSSTASPEVESASTTVGAAATQAAQVQAEKKTAQKSGQQGKMLYLQLGLFKGKDNAQAYLEKAKEKGFDARVESEVRPSGTTYYLVVVDDNREGTMASELRDAGFDCYPVFE